MSGPEWTVEQPESPDDARPLSRLEAVHDQNRDPVPSFDQAHAQPSEPAMDHDLDTPDRDDPTPSPVDHRPRPNLVATVLGLLSKIPLPSIGSERHEMVLDQAPPTHQPAGTHAASGPQLVHSRFTTFALKRETRVGIAAVISFVVLVGSFLYQRGWSKGGTGKPSVSEKSAYVLAIKHGADGTNPEEPKKPGEAGDPKDQSKKGPSDGDKPTKSPEPPPTPKKTEPEPGREPDPGEPSEIPPKPIEGLNPHELGERPSPESPPSLPGTLEPPALPDPKSEPPAIPVQESVPATPEPKPHPAETTPAPAPDASTLPAPTGESATMPPPVEPTPAPPTTAEVVPEPMTPPSSPPVGAASPEAVPAQPTLPVEPPPTPAASPASLVPSGPVPTEKPPTLETVPAGSIEPAGTKTSTSAALRAGWIAIPSGGRRIIGAVPIISTPAEAQVDTPRIADGPRVVDDPNAVDQVEPVVHTVQPGENFWTISKLYYRSPRFYKALHAANRGQVPDITKLYVGTVLRIPPPEALDRSLIDPPSRTGGDDPKTSPVNRTSNSKKVGPPSAEEADLGMPARRRVVRPDVDADPEAEPERKPVRRPSYKIKEHDTLRSIARDNLGDSRRDREIYNLNRDVLDDFDDDLPVGTTLTLPSDAIVGRRSR